MCAFPAARIAQRLATHINSSFIDSCTNTAFMALSSGVDVGFLLPVSLAANRTCSETQHNCGHPLYQCIPKLWHCDGKDDCDNGSDEQDCSK